MKTKLQFFKYVSLNMLSMLGISCYILADTLFISNGVGLGGLTALNIVLPLYNVIFSIALLLGVGGATCFSIYKAQNKKHIASQFFTYTVQIAIIVSIPLTIIGLLMSHQVVKVLGASGYIVEMASLYLRNFIGFTPFFFSQQILLCFLRNDNNPRLASFAMLIGTAFNIVFDYILIFVCHMGMKGAALATGFSPIITTLICCIHFIQKKNNFHYIHTSINLQYIKRMIQIGIPSFITELSSGVIIFVFNLIILSISGNVGIASFGIISNLALVITSLFTGISQGVQPLMSHSYGTHNFKEIKDYLKLSIISSLVLSLLIWLMTLLFPEIIVSFFNSENNQTIIELTCIGLPLYFFGYFFVGINMIFVSYFASTSQIKPSSSLSLLRSGIVLIPLTLILSQIWGLIGVWISYPVSEFIIIFISLYFKRKQQLQ